MNTHMHTVMLSHIHIFYCTLTVVCCRHILRWRRMEIMFLEAPEKNSLFICHYCHLWIIQTDGNTVLKINVAVYFSLVLFFDFNSAPQTNCIDLPCTWQKSQKWISYGLHKTQYFQLLIRSVITLYVNKSIFP